MKEVKAFVSEEDGKMFTNRGEAIAHEVRLRLLRVFIEAGCNDALAQALWARAEGIALAAEPLAQEIQKHKKETGG